MSIPETDNDHLADIFQQITEICSYNVRAIVIFLITWTKMTVDIFISFILHLHSDNMAKFARSPRARVVSLVLRLPHKKLA